MCGMSEKKFLHSTLREINEYIEHYQKEKEYHAKELEYHAWCTGLYVQKAIASCFDKKAKYPKNPLEEEPVIQEMDLTEDQADFYRDQFLKRLQRMENKFNKAKKKTDTGEE